MILIVAGIAIAFYFIRFVMQKRVAQLKKRDVMNTRRRKRMLDSLKKYN